MAGVSTTYFVAILNATIKVHGNRGLPPADMEAFRVACQQLEELYLAAPLSAHQDAPEPEPDEED